MVGGAVVTLLTTASDASGPVPHEKFELDPAEDLHWGATTARGAMPAAVRTRSGVVAAPDPAQGALAGGQVYGGTSTQTSVDASYRLDRLTTRPQSVRYDAPFRPTVMPFKRVYAFDRIEPSLSLGVFDQTLQPVPMGGMAEAHEDLFFADFEVNLTAEVPVRIPSVGPGARVRALQVEPPMPVEIVEDGAGNWFARSQASGRARFVMQLSIDRRSFGDAYPPIGWEALEGQVPPVPPEARTAARRVIEHIGIEDPESPAHALHALIDYFRRFRDSEQLPTSTTPRELYLELSLEQKGVCRHRAYAFLVTAQVLGLPTRLVHNEAHAWVEVADDERWYRIDLGGAATRVNAEREEQAPPHQPPPDPFSWPRGGQPGAALAEPARSAASRSRALETEQPGSPTRGVQRSTASRAREPEGDAGPNVGGEPTRSSQAKTRGDGLRAAPDDEPSATLGKWWAAAVRKPEPPPPEISLKIHEAEVKRGSPLVVSGRATRQGKPCRLARLDVILKSGETQRVAGSVATDRDGYFLGQVTIPRDSPVGSHSLLARIGAGCED